MKFSLAILAILWGAYCFAFYSKGSMSRPSIQRPKIDEAMEAAKQGQIEYIKIFRHPKVDARGDEFLIGGEAYARPLFRELYKSYDAKRDVWNCLPDMLQPGMAQYKWFIVVRFSLPRFRRGDTLLVPEFGFFVPGNESRVFSAKAQRVLQDLVAKASKDPDHFLGE